MMSKLQQELANIAALEASRDAMITDTLQALQRGEVTIAQAVEQINVIWVDSKLKQLDLVPGNYPALLT